MEVLVALLPLIQAAIPVVTKMFETSPTNPGLPGLFTHVKGLFSSVEEAVADAPASADHAAKMARLRNDLDALEVRLIAANVLVQTAPEPDDQP